MKTIKQINEDPSKLTPIKSGSALAAGRRGVKKYEQNGV